MSGSRLPLAAIVTAGAIVLVGTACGADDSAPANSLAAATHDLTSTPVPLDVALGALLTSAEATDFLPPLNGGRPVQPVAAYGSRFLLPESPTGPADPRARHSPSGVPSPANARPHGGSERGRQDIVTGLDGDTVIAVRTGLALPFAEWRIDAHNLATGRSHTIASAQAGVVETPAISAGPPFGFAPYPSVRDGRLAWVELRLGAMGPERHVRLHDLATGPVTTLTAVTGPDRQYIASPVIGGGRVAWARWTADGLAQVEVHELSSGATSVFALEAKSDAIALSADGAILAWDDARGGKYVVPIGGGPVLRFAGDEGWGLIGVGNRFAWAPAPAYGGTGGYFDLDTDELRLVERRTGVLVNQATVVGDWFAWQEIHSGDGVIQIPASPATTSFALDPA